jgi:hypothetical protein
VTAFLAFASGVPAYASYENTLVELVYTFAYRPSDSREFRTQVMRVSIVLQENGQYYLEQVNNIDAPESERTPDYSVTGGLERWQTIENNLAVRFNLHKNVLTGLYRNSYYFRDLEVELENGSCVGHVGID